MKRVLTTILVCFTFLSAFGQERSDTVNRHFFDAKIREFVYQLKLTDEQKEAFIPIYERYNEEMRQTIGRPELHGKHGQRPADSEKAAEMTKARIERQQLAQSVRLKYVDEFATVLDPAQLERLYDVEDQIQRKLMQRKNGHRPGRGGPGGDKGPRGDKKGPR